MDAERDDLQEQVDQAIRATQRGQGVSEAMHRQHVEAVVRQRHQEDRILADAGLLEVPGAREELRRAMAQSQGREAVEARAKLGRSVDTLILKLQHNAGRHQAATVAGCPACQPGQVPADAASRQPAPSPAERDHALTREKAIALHERYGSYRKAAKHSDWEASHIYRVATGERGKPSD